MEFDPDWNEEIMVELSVDDTRENGDFMMLEELHQQEEVLMVFESVQQLAETELSKLNEIQVSDAKWKHNSVIETSNDSNETVFSTFTQDDENYEDDLQLIEDPFIVNSILEDEDVLVEDPLFIDCGTTDCNDDVGLFNESQMDCILMEYFEKYDSSLRAIDNTTTDKAKVESQLCKVKVCLERLPQSVIESITKTKVDSADMENTKSTDHKKCVQRYCLKCEKYSLDDVKISRPKNCQDCGDSLLYSCTKCQIKFFQTYCGMANHRKVCKSKKVFTDVAKSTDFYVCRDCDFRTLHENSMVRHLRKTKHRLDDDDGAEQVKAREIKYTKQYEKDYTKAFQRYCDKCKKSISSTSLTDNKLCRTCNTRLLYRCLKCGRKSKSHKSLVYHLKYQCLPKSYSCSKCDYSTTNHKSMVRHLKHQHPAERIFCEHCDYETTRKSGLVKHLAFQHDVGEGFVCQICNRFKTTDESRLEQHMLRKHPEKGERYTCAICRRYETNDQEDLRRHIDRRHRET